MQAKNARVRTIIVSSRLFIDSLPLPNYILRLSLKTLYPTLRVPSRHIGDIKKNEAFITTTYAVRCVIQPHKQRLRPRNETSMPP